MQRIGYGLADFFISWLRIERNLERTLLSEPTEMNLALILKDALETRKNELFETPSMTAAIYLDPRVKSKLDARQKEIAILHLKTLYSRILKLKMPEPEANELPNNTLDELNEEFADDESELYPPDVVDTSALMMSFSKYDMVKHVDIKSNVMDFWKKNKDEFSLIYHLARVIHGIPAGQCYEEQNFSSFSYIRSGLRTSLKAENVKNILLIRLNKELFYDQRMETINKIKSHI